MARADGLVISGDRRSDADVRQQPDAEVTALVLDILARQGEGPLHAQPWTLVLLARASYQRLLDEVTEAGRRKTVVAGFPGRLPAHRRRDNRVSAR